MISIRFFSYRYEASWSVSASGWGYLYEDGSEAIPFELDAAWNNGHTYYHTFTDSYTDKKKAYDSTDGFVVTYKNGDYALYQSKNAQIVIPYGTFAEILPVHDGKAWVKDKNSGLWGVIELKTNINVMRSGNDSITETSPVPEPPTEPPTDPPTEPPTKPTKPAADADNIIDTYINQLNVWEEYALAEDTMGMCSVTFLDIDFDGEPELVTAYEGGTGFFTELRFYKIVNGKVTELSIDEEFYDYPDIIYYENEYYNESSRMKLYQSSDGSMEYYDYDFMRYNVYSGQESLCSFAFHEDKQAVIVTNHCTFTYTYGDSGDEEWYDNNNRKVSESERKSIEDGITAGLRDMHLKFKFVDIREVNTTDERKRLLKEAYQSFGYDSYN